MDEQELDLECIHCKKDRRGMIEVWRAVHASSFRVPFCCVVAVQVGKDSCLISILSFAQNCFAKKHQLGKLPTLNVM